MADATWLADVLRDAGLFVEGHDGWKTRGRPGGLGEVKGVMVHHTSSNPKGGNTAALSTILNGRPEDNLPGPLSQLLLARDGTWHVIAAGRCNHAGKGKWQGVTSGNYHFIGVEAENNGKGEVWPGHQLDSLLVGVAAILKHIGADAVMCVGHKEWALPKGRKIDPSFDMVAFREDLDALMKTGVVPATPVVPTVSVDRAMLRKGSMGPSVRVLQKALGITADGDFGPKTETAVKAFQRAHGLTVDGLVGPATWRALGY